MEDPPNQQTSKTILQDQTKPLWTVVDVASYLRLHPETVRAMARDGRIPSVKVGKTWRFYSDQIKTLLFNGIR
jgi:excisionase family DNA binding protein